MNIKMEMEKYDSFHMIGAGSYGTVYSAREIATNRIVAVKIIKKVSFGTNDFFFVMFHV